MLCETTEAAARKKMTDQSLIGEQIGLLANHMPRPGGKTQRQNKLPLVRRFQFCN